MKEIKLIHPKWLALITASVGFFMGTLDFSIVNISFPRLTKIFETDPTVVLWVTVVYLLVSTGLLLVFGRIGDMFGRKRIYILGFVIFTIGLTLCAVSQSILQLILARILQAVGAAMVVALSTAIVIASFPSHERGKALGIVSAVLSAGILIGPVLGGLLLDTLGWRSIFYIRVPVGIIGIIMAWAFLQEQKDLSISTKVDILGAATIFIGLSCLLAFFNLGVRLGYLSGPVIILLIGAIISLALFVVHERRTEQPLVDLNLFRNRLFAGGNISLAIMAFTLSSQMFLMPFYLIDGIGYSALEAGLLLAVTYLSALLIAPLSGRLSDRLGARLLSTVGMILFCISLFLFSRFGIESTITYILFSLVVFGIGLGVFMSPNSSSIMGAVPKDRLGTASAMMNTVRQVGLSSGMAIAGVIFASRQSFYAAQLANDNLDSLTLNKFSLIGSFQDTLFMAAIVCGIGILASLVRANQQSNRE